MIKYALNLDENGRILCATYEEYAFKGNIIVEELPEGDIHNYLYIDGEYVFDPVETEPEEDIPSQLDTIEAQVFYTAMMTDTLLEG